MKVILKGPKSCSYDLGNGFIPAGVVVDVTPAELKDAEKSSMNIIDEYIDKKPTAKKYTEKQLFAWNKAKQVAEIEKLGLKPALLEKGRVKQILEAQK